MVSGRQIIGIGYQMETHSGEKEMLDEILKLILALLPALNISDLDKIDAEIQKMKEKKIEQRKRYLKAIQEMDIPTLNALDSEFFDQL